MSPHIYFLIFTLILFFSAVGFVIAVVFTPPPSVNFGYNNINFKSGDLVFFSGENMVEKTIRLHGGCPWSHVGMILIIRNKPYIVHLEGDRIKQKRGVKIEYLPRKLASITAGDNYTNFMGWMGICTSIEIDPDTVIKFVESKKYLLDTRYLAYFFSNYPRIHHRVKNEKFVICSEFIALLLNHLGLLLKNQTNFSSYNTSRLWHQNFVTPANCFWFEGKTIGGN